LLHVSAGRRASQRGRITSDGLVPTTVECFGLRLDAGRPVGRLVTSLLGDDPDDTAAMAIGLRGSPLDGTAVLHSTSWRWERGVGLVLTYLCAPDPLGTPVSALVVPAHGHPHDVAGPSHPGEGSPSPAQVLHHGIDHFAWLADHHSQLVERSRVAAPELWASILENGRHRAGRFGGHGSR
jgi:hypothetical protein